MSDSAPIVCVYAHAVERLERNGKWKIRGVAFLTDACPEQTSTQRYRGPLVQAEGATVDAAEAEARRRFSADPACRPYVAHAINGATRASLG